MSLRGIFLVSSPLEDPPIEIAQKVEKPIARYFGERGTDDLPLNEVKVILVGNGTAGKTSLVKAVFGEQFNPNEQQTHGITIRPMSLQLSDGQKITSHF